MRCQVELNEWERALAVAPLLGLAYWQDLCTKYAQCLEATMNDAAVPFYIAAGQVGGSGGYSNDAIEKNPRIRVSARIRPGLFAGRMQAPPPPVY
jgi:hypothetical protein